MAPTRPSGTLTRPAARTEIRIFVKSAHIVQFPWELPEKVDLSEDERRQISLSVDPTLTIRDFKVLLKPYSWIPRHSLLLINQSSMSPMYDVNSTLEECGVKDEDSLLVCMDEPFEVALYSVDRRLEISVPVMSCTSTVESLKLRMEIITGYPAVGHRVFLPDGYEEAPLADDMPLLELNIVKPYLWEMRNRLSLKVRLAKPAKPAKPV